MNNTPEKQRRLLVTAALPYANGPIHLGHLLEHIQTDIWVRFQRMRGHHCLAICADDAHGTPIMLKAKQANVTPEDMISAIKIQHEADFNDFGIHYDNYHSTHSAENETLCIQIYEKLLARGDIVTREIEQLFDPVENLFLPDRFVKGDCPRCHATAQNGDNCEVCGATYSPTEVKNPVSVLSGATPILRTSTHFFFDLPRYKTELYEWTQAGHLQEEIKNKLNEWFEAGLVQWDISRDAPYFGFEIPNQPDKYFYVWLDAPIGYIASFQHYTETHHDYDFNTYWGEDSEVELYHFIGKDIIYFHALFWPAMLSGANLRLPTAVFAHGFVTVNGEKMSKSRGTFITARVYLNHLDPAYLRYYFAAKLNNRIDDIDFNLDDFQQRINSDLVGKVVNIASRTSSFIHKYCDATLSTEFFDKTQLELFITASESIATYYENRDYSRAVKEIMLLADKANQFIDEYKPWLLIKDPANTQQVQAICTQGLEYFRLLALYLKPILPSLAEKAETLLKIAPLQWRDVTTSLSGSTINPFVPMMLRIDKDAIAAMLDENEKCINPA